MENTPFLARQSPGLRLLSLILIIIISLLITLLLGTLASYPFWGKSILNIGVDPDFSNHETISILKYYQIISQFGFFIFPVLLFAWLSDRKVIPYLQIGRTPHLITAGLTLFLLLLSMPLIGWMLDLNQQMKLPGFLGGMENWMKESEDSASVLTRAFLSTGSWGGLSVNLVMIAILPAIGEEFLFRGVLVRLFTEWSGNKHLAVISSAFLFSAMHLQFYGFFPRFMLGILLGYLFIWTSNLWVPVLAHFTNNVVTVISAFLFQRGVIHTDYETIGNSVSLSQLLVSIAATLILLWLIYKSELQRRLRAAEAETQ